MSHNYWAEFKQIGNDIFRFDTRIYLEPIDAIGENDCCIGAVVGKNPGSAVSSAIGKGIQEIKLNGDKLLPNVRSIVKKSYKVAMETPPVRGYIQVLNLFYLCDPNLEQAKLKFKQCNKVEYCPTENQHFPWVWYLWGDSDIELNPHKRRFDTLDTTNHFYYDNKELGITLAKPSETVLARHTQGLKHDFVVPDISTKLIKKQTFHSCE